LKEFYSERDAREKLFEDLKSSTEDEAGKPSLTMDAFAEDWNESQFWVCKKDLIVPRLNAQKLTAHSIPKKQPRLWQISCLSIVPARSPLL
jgi:hypothetical protein